MASSVLVWLGQLILRTMWNGSEDAGSGCSLKSAQAVSDLLSRLLSLSVHKDKVSMRIDLMIAAFECKLLTIQAGTMPLELLVLVVLLLELHLLPLTRQ